MPYLLHGMCRLTCDERAVQNSCVLRNSLDQVFALPIMSWYSSMITCTMSFFTGLVYVSFIGIQLTLSYPPKQQSARLRLRRPGMALPLAWRVNDHLMG